MGSVKGGTVCKTVRTASKEPNSLLFFVTKKPFVDGLNFWRIKESAGKRWNVQRGRGQLFSLSLYHPTSMDACTVDLSTQNCFDVLRAESSAEFIHHVFKLNRELRLHPSLTLPGWSSRLHWDAVYNVWITMSTSCQAGYCGSSKPFPGWTFFAIQNSLGRDMLTSVIKNIDTIWTSHGLRTVFL